MSVATEKISMVSVQGMAKRKRQRCAWLTHKKGGSERIEMKGLRRGRPVNAVGGAWRPLDQ